MGTAGTMALDQSRDGKVEGFRMLVAEHSQKMFRLAYRMTGNEQDAEDVVQETFFRVYRQFGRFETREHLSSWLHRIASNYAIDLLRRRERWKKADLDQIEQVDPLRGTEPDPDRSTWSAEVRAAVEKEMDRLTPRERVAFTLRHHEGLSIREIGEVMGLRESATKNHIFRAVHKMRAALAPLVGESR